MLCDWEGNRRSGVALAMRHGLSGIPIPTYRLSGLGKGDEQCTPPVESSLSVASRVVGRRLLLQGVILRENSRKVNSSFHYFT